MTDRPWTSGEDEILRSMREEDLSRPMIAQRLERTVTAVAKRIERLSLAKPYFEWTPERDAELRRLREMKPPLGYNAIGARLGCTRNAAIGRAHRIGVKGHGYGSIIEGQPRYKPAREPRPYRPKVRKQRTFPVEIIEPPIPYNFVGVSFFDLQPRQCRYPRGEGASMLFCGAPADDGTSWCAHCRSVVFSPVRYEPSRRRAA